MEPIKPPVEGQVLRVRRWSEVFETAKSRGYTQLSWISVPNSFDSAGYLSMCAEFDGLELGAVYGAWNALCLQVSRAPKKELRGYLCGDRGQLHNTKMLHLITRQPIEAFELLIPWAIKEGWLEWAFPGESYTSPCPVPGESLAGSLPNEPDQTKPNKTPPNEPTASPEWGEIVSALNAQGVEAATKAVNMAKAAGWTQNHAAEVLKAVSDRPGAFKPFQIYARWQLPASVGPDDGWPEPSKAFKAGQLAARRLAAAERQQVEAKERRATKTIEPAVANMAAHVKKTAAEMRRQRDKPNPGKRKKVSA